VIDAAACALLYLLGEALVSTCAGVVAGLLMAVSPQFAYLSLVLKPDTLVVVPVLVALLFLVRALDRRAIRSWAFAGLALGVGCWLRQNALLLAPALAVLALVTAGVRANWKGAATMVLTCVALVAPLTIRNLVIYGEPIPVTIGSGFALLSGLARDDYAGRYGLSRFAYNVSVEEAAERGFPRD
jgi:4-amino-4-deoxy-L-arabinose transferase-like glycosyltransferase